MSGFAQDMMRLADQIRESSRERAGWLDGFLSDARDRGNARRLDAPRRAQEMKSFLQKTRTERQLRERQEHQRLRDFTRARLVESNARKDSLVQFVKTNRSQVQASLDRLRTEFREGARAFRAGLGQVARAPSRQFPAGDKPASAAMPLNEPRFTDRAEAKSAFGKRGMRARD